MGFWTGAGPASQACNRPQAPVKSARAAIVLIVNASLDRLLSESPEGRAAAKSVHLLRGGLAGEPGLLRGAGHQLGVAAAVFVLGVGLPPVLPPFLIQGHALLVEVWQVLAAFNKGVSGHETQDGFEEKENLTVAQLMDLFHKNSGQVLNDDALVLG